MRPMLGRRRSIEERLVWIWGSPRSGSTWLLLLMKEHEAVVPINEPQLGVYFGPFLSDLPGWRTAELDATNFSVRKVQEEREHQFFANQFADVWRPALAEMIHRRYEAHVKKHPPKNGDLANAIVAIKEPNGSQSADIIMGALPKAPFLFLLRDGRDVVDSDLAANSEGSWVTEKFPGARGVTESERLEFVEQSAQKWLVRTEIVQQAYRAHPGPKHFVKYEDLRADPAGHLRPIFDWLGLELSDEKLGELIDKNAFEKAPEDQKGAKGFFRAATPGFWEQNLREDEKAAMERILGPKLRELDYS